MFGNIFQLTNNTEAKNLDPRMLNARVVINLSVGSFRVSEQLPTQSRCSESPRREGGREGGRRREKIGREEADLEQPASKIAEAHCV